MHTILFLPNDHILCWAGRVPAGTLPRAFARMIEESAPRQVQRLAEAAPEELAPENLRPQPAAAPEELAAPESLRPQPAAAPESLLPQPAAAPEELAPEVLHSQPASAPESLLPQPAAESLAGSLYEGEIIQTGSRVIAMQAVLHVLVGAGDMLQAGVGSGDDESRGSRRFGLAQRFIVPPNLALRVAVLPDVLLIRADPPMELAPGSVARRVPALTSAERGLLRVLSREKSVRGACKVLGVSRRHVFTRLAKIRLKIGRMLRELESGARE